MKHAKCLSLITACSLAFSVPASSVIPQMQPASAAAKRTSSSVRKKGWVTVHKNKKRYYVKGSYVTGLQTIRNKTYYFNQKGFLQTGTVKIKRGTLYLDENGVVIVKKLRSGWYDKNNKKMTSVEIQDFQTLLTAKSIVSQITTATMTNEQKLKACFDWVIHKPYVTRRVFSNVSGWPAVYANDHFKLGGGNCFADACAFAYLARALGYSDVYACVDCDGTNGRGHSWAEVGGLAYDPLFAEAKNYNSYYGVPYSVYPLHPILRVRIDQPQS